MLAWRKDTILSRRRTLIAWSCSFRPPPPARFRRRPPWAALNRIVIVNKLGSRLTCRKSVSTLQTKKTGFLQIQLIINKSVGRLSETHLCQLKIQLTRHGFVMSIFLIKRILAIFVVRRSTAVLNSLQIPRVAAFNLLIWLTVSKHKRMP